jgi:hypothetical protein
MLENVSRKRVAKTVSHTALISLKNTVWDANILIHALADG